MPSSLEHLLSLVRRFVDGNERTLALSGEIEAALEEQFGDEEPFASVALAIASYRPEGGPFLYGESEMVGKLRDVLRLLEQGVPVDTKHVTQSLASQSISDDELLRIERVCAAATAAPWKSFVEGRDHESGSDFIQTPRGDIELSGASHADQDFIASARQDIPKLLLEVHRLREVVRACAAPLS